jgi:hypothetical protein
LESIYNDEHSGDASSDPLAQIDLFELFMNSVSSSPVKKEQGKYRKKNRKKHEMCV